MKEEDVTDPARLMEGGGSPLEQRWLLEVRAEEPPLDVVLGIERALGIGAGGAPPAQPAAATAGAAARGGMAAARLLGLAALGVGGAVGLVLILTRPAPTPAPAPAPVAVEPLVAPAAVVPPAAAGPSHDRAREGVSPAAGATEGPAAGALGDEIALIDGARAALAAGAPARALDLLDRYRARHPRGVLLPEATAMRIDAIDRTGQHARARAMAREFLAEHPDSPLGQRLARLGAAASDE